MDYDKDENDEEEDGDTVWESVVLQGHCDDDGDDEDGGTDNDNGEEEDEDDGDAGGESVSPQRLCEFCHTTIQLPSHMIGGWGWW